MTVHAASSAESPVDPSAMAFVIARLLCVRGFAAARRPLIRAPIAGNSGMRRRMVLFIPPPKVHAAMREALRQHLGYAEILTGRFALPQDGVRRAPTHSATS